MLDPRRAQFHAQNDAYQALLAAVHKSRRYGLHAGRRNFSAREYERLCREADRAERAYFATRPGGIHLSGEYKPPAELTPQQGMLY